MRVSFCHSIDTAVVVAFISLSWSSLMFVASLPLIVSEGKTWALDAVTTCAPFGRPFFRASGPSFTDRMSPEVCSES